MTRSHAGSRKSSPLWILAGLGLVLAITTSYSCKPDHDSDFLQEAYRLVDKTLPKDGRSFGLSAIRPSTYSKEVSWEFEMPMGWKDYEKWIKPRLGDFRMKDENEERIVFLRHSEGDQYSVVIEKLQQPHRYRASFSSSSY